MNSYTLRVGGEAGWGIATVAKIFSQLCGSLGNHVFASKDYASQIKGGHNSHTTRFSLEPVGADVNKIDILLALDQTTLDRHLEFVTNKGIVFYDNRLNVENSDQEDKKFVSISVVEVEKEMGEKNLRNAIFLGAVVKSQGLEFEKIKSIIISFFEKKPKLKEILIKAAEKGYNEVEKLDATCFEKSAEEKNVQLIDGNKAISLGALKAGVTFHAQYPMTPVTGILHNLAKESVKNKNLVVVQPEDEIATINMALGASYAGARAMTATSGGGFALMVESVGLASMAEVPLVIIEGQRPGPSTGLPTKQEQGDLSFVISAGTGDFPLVVIAPGDQEECYTETKRAFYLAEKHHLPAIVLVDKHLTESFKTVDLETVEKEFTFDYGKRINIVDSADNSLINEEGLYKRYANGNLQRSLPGSKLIYTCAGDEHDDVGYITEDPDIRNKMMARRMGKLAEIEKELPVPELIGVKDAELTIVSFGSCKGAITEAVEKLNAEGKSTNVLMIKYMVPFQKEGVGNILKRAKKLVLIENNYSSQLGKLIAEHTGVQIVEKILRSDGKTFSADDIYEELSRKW